MMGVSESHGDNKPGHREYSGIFSDILDGVHAVT